MTADRITYKQMDELLGELGFSRVHVEPKWLRYEHVDSGTVIVLVEKKPNELVRATDAVSARRHLIEKGLVSPTEMDAILAGQAIQQATSGGKNK